jgi:hypothetical protein
LPKTEILCRYQLNCFFFNYSITNCADRLDCSPDGIEITSGVQAVRLASSNDDIESSSLSGGRDVVDSAVGSLRSGQLLLAGSAAAAVTVTIGATTKLQVRVIQKSKPNQIKPNQNQTKSKYTKPNHLPRNKIHTHTGNRNIVDKSD